MVNGRVTEKDVHNFTGYISQMGEEQVVEAFHELQGLSDKNGGPVNHEDCRTLNRIVQKRAFYLTGLWKPVKWEPSWLREMREGRKPRPPENCWKGTARYSIGWEEP